jgi:hypothetical protein
MPSTLCMLARCALWQSSAGRFASSSSTAIRAPRFRDMSATPRWPQTGQRSTLMSTGALAPFDPNEKDVVFRAGRTSSARHSKCERDASDSAWTTLTAARCRCAVGSFTIILCIAKTRKRFISRASKGGGLNTPLQWPGQSRVGKQRLTGHHAGWSCTLACLGSAFGELAGAVIDWLPEFEDTAPREG